MAFQMVEISNKVYCDGGMSAEIAFTKYFAHRIKKVYSGWNISIRMVFPDIILHSLHNVVSTVKAVENAGCQKTVLHSPGFMSVPYLVELCNFVYLPSQFLVGFKRVSDLKDVLSKLEKNGIKAYAVAGYDGCIPNCLVAWIKFLEIPPCYLELINDFIQSEKVILSGVYDPESNTIGENIIYQYEKNTKKIESGNIYFLHIHTCYGENNLEKDWNIFKKLCYDFNPESVYHHKRAFNVGDWESAFDIMNKKYMRGYKRNTHFLYAKDTKPLYDLSFDLAEFFIKINQIPVKGIVLNPYIMNTPTYETNYGYIAYCYWGGSNHVDKEIYEKYKPGMEIWLNDQCSQKEKLRNELISRGYKIKYINNSSSLCEELTHWILSWKPKKYLQREFVSVGQLKKLCSKISFI